MNGAAGSARLRAPRKPCAAPATRPSGGGSSRPQRIQDRQAKTSFDSSTTTPASIRALSRPPRRANNGLPAGRRLLAHGSPALPLRRGWPARRPPRKPRAACSPRHSASRLGASRSSNPAQRWRPASGRVDIDRQRAAEARSQLLFSRFRATPRARECLGQRPALVLQFAVGSPRPGVSRHPCKPDAPCPPDHPAGPEPTGQAATDEWLWRAATRRRSQAVSLLRKALIAFASSWLRLGGTAPASNSMMSRPDGSVRSTATFRLPIRTGVSVAF